VESSNKNVKIIKLAFRIVITSGLLLWVFSQIDFKEFWLAAKTARWEFLLAVWVTTLIRFWIRSIKMQFILRRQNCIVSVGTVFCASAVTSLYSMVMPGLLSTGVKWYILKKDTGKGTNVFSALVYNQLLTIIVMGIFGLVALVVSNPTSLAGIKRSWLLPAICGAVATAIIIACFLLLNRQIGSKIVAALKVLIRPFPSKMRQKGEEILEQVGIFQTAGASFHLLVTVITIIATPVMGIVVYVLSAKGANLVAPIGVFVWLAALVYVLGRVPMSIANLGIRESLLVSLLSLYGVEKSAALLMSMILFSRLVFMALVGAACQLYWLTKQKKSTA
jgi:uncharacterized membrane protein YbhN (UPF0104 family)